MCPRKCSCYGKTFFSRNISKDLRSIAKTLILYHEKVTKSGLGSFMKKSMSSNLKKNIN